jgi:hypothetical protein
LVYFVRVYRDKKVVGVFVPYRFLGTSGHQLCRCNASPEGQCQQAKISQMSWVFTGFAACGGLWSGSKARTRWQL